MNAYATIEFLSHNTIINGRPVRQAMVDLSDSKGMLACFLVFGFSTQELKDRAYSEADHRAQARGLTLQSLRAA